MKLRHRHLTPIIILIGLAAGYYAEPALFLQFIRATADPTSESHQAAQNKKKGGKKSHHKEVIDPKDTGEAEPSPDQDLVDDTHDDDSDELLVDDDSTTDPSTFKDGDEDKDEEAMAKRLATYKKASSKQSDIILVQEEKFIGKESASAWSNVKALKRRIGSRIQTRLKGVDPEHLEAFIRVPENRLLLAQWQMLHNGDEKQLNALFKDKNNAKLLTPLLNDLQWMGEFVYDGKLLKPEISLAIMAHLRASDPNMDLVNLTEEKGDMLRDVTIKRRIAGAIAAEFGNQNKVDDNAQKLDDAELRLLKQDGIVLPKLSNTKGKSDIYRFARENYLFFAEGVDDRLFHSSFYSTPGWLMRL